MEKKISIILPCYNVEQYLDRCFNSLKNQTIGFENMELIFVNDASTDGTLDKLASLEQQYPDNILVINFTENRRQGTARNVALEYASAPYIGYVDSDDWVDHTMFEKMVNAIEQYDCDFVECRWNLAKDEKHATSIKRLGDNGYLDLTDPATRAKFIGDQIGITALWSKVFKKSFLIDNDIFCPEQIRYEDIFFCYLAFLYAKSYYRIDEELYHYFVNPEGTVQRKSQEYQFDKMTIALGFLQACRERGLFAEEASVSNNATTQAASSNTNNTHQNSNKVISLADRKNNKNDALAQITTKDCIEWMFLEKYYVYMLWEIFQEFPERSYDYFIEMRETVLAEVPDYKTNPFRKWESNAFDNLMLNFLNHEFTRNDLESLRDDLLIKFDKKPADNNTSNNIKHTSHTTRILFCKWTSICETGIDNGFKQLGFDVDYITQPFQGVDYDRGYLETLNNRLLQQEYDCVFTVNFIPIVARVCNVFKIPYVCWTADNPCFQLYSDTIKLPWNRIFMFDQSQYNKFSPLNPDCCFHKSLGCDYETWNSMAITAKDHAEYDCDVSFIGSTYQEKCRYNKIEHIPDYIQGYVDGLINAQLNVYGYNFIEDSLSDEFCIEFKKTADWYPLGEDYVEDTRAIIADSYIGYKCTEQERIRTLKNISEHFSLDLYTQSDTSHFPKAHDRGAADSETMMPKIFKCSKINLNMTNRPIRTGLPLRIFDIMGAGGFLITNYQTELSDNFVIGEDLVAYDSQEDLLNKIAYYLEHDDERIAIAKNGQEKIRKYHTFTIKLNEIMHEAGII